jgi:hypothetical protein
MATPHKDIPKLLSGRKSVRLDIACGDHKQAEDWIGLDIRDLPGVDIVLDLEKFPWPLPDSCARAVVMCHFWEHIKPWLTMPFMAELHRVCADGASVMISAPYGVEFRYVQDPTHCNPANEATFTYWDSNLPLWQVYKPPVFHLQSFEVMPVGGFGRDYNAILTCCKRTPCPHKNMEVKVADAVKVAERT